jgi:hypothetical protein
VHAVRSVLERQLNFSAWKPHYYVQQCYQKYATSEWSLQVVGKWSDLLLNILLCDEAVILFGGFAN